MYSSAIVLGYHGCDREVGEAILAGKAQVEASRNPYDWLGAGAYFWENDPGRAKKWADLIALSPQNRRHRIKDPFVIGAILDLGHCLDLTETESLDLLREAHAEMARAFAKVKVPMPQNLPGFKGDKDFVKRHLDCAVINYLHSLRKVQKSVPFDSVRGAFLEGKPIFDGARILEKTHIQVCILNPRESVRGYFRLQV